MASRNSLPHRLRNHFREHSLAYQLLLILGGTVVAAGGFIVVTRMMQRAHEQGYSSLELSDEDLAELTADPADQVFPQPIGLQTYNLRQVVEFALAAQGGRENLEAIKSISRKGRVTLRQEGRKGEMDGVILYRRPNQIRYVYSRESLSYFAAFDGTSGWKQASADGVRQPPEETSPLDTLFMRQDVTTVQPLSVNLADLTQLQLAESLPETERPAYGIVHDLGWMSETLFFDRVNFLCFRRDVELPTSDGTVTRIRLEYDDFRYVERVVFPFSVRVWVNDELANEVSLSSIELNVGMLPFLFEKPSVAPEP